MIWEIGLHPALIQKVRTILVRMNEIGHPMRVVQGIRTREDQQALYARGRTVKGPIVTYADGVTHKSNHQPQADGFGHAVDLAFIGNEPFAESHPWALFGETVNAEGLIWGGDWTRLVDRPHAELPANYREDLKA